MSHLLLVKLSQANSDLMQMLQSPSILYGAKRPQERSDIPICLFENQIENRHMCAVCNSPRSQNFHDFVQLCRLA